MLAESATSTYSSKKAALRSATSSIPTSAGDKRWPGCARSVIASPYCARHSSVSWDLTIGRNPLWVAKQHGHSITTMSRVYAAWAEDAIEADIKAIDRAVQPARSAAETLLGGAADAASAITASDSARSKPDTVGRTSFGSRFGSPRQRPDTKCRNRKGNGWRRERDSNPRRAFDPYTLSRGAPSTTRPSLRL